MLEYRGLAETGEVNDKTIEGVNAAMPELEPSANAGSPPQGSGDDPLEPGPRATPGGHADPFRTSATTSGNANGTSTTTGLTGTSHASSNTTIVTDAPQPIP